MNMNWFSLSKLGVMSRLMLWFLVIALIPCILMTVVTNRLSMWSLEKTLRGRLVAITAFKGAELDSFAREREGDMTVLSQIDATRDAIEELTKDLDGRATVDAAAVARRTLPGVQIFCDAYGYENVYLFDPQGRLLYRIKTDLDFGDGLLTGPLKNSELAEVFLRAKMLFQAEASDFQIYPGLSDPALFIAQPVFNDGKLIGVVALQVGNREIYRVFQDYNGLGETGEALVGMRKGDEITLLTPVRHDRDAAFQRRVKMGDPRAKPLQYAAQGERGYGDMIDYRGEPVMASWAYVPAFRWALCVKQDRSEAFAMINQQRLAVVTLLGVTAAAVAFVAWRVARTISQPIRQAALIANRVAGGDLTTSYEGQAPGEMGLLLTAIRKMTGDLRGLIGRIQKSSIALMSTATEISATSRAAGAGGLRVRRLDQRGRRRRQRDLGHQPGTAQDHDRGQRGGPPDRAAWRRPAGTTCRAWTGPCGSSPSRPARSAPSSRSSASARPTSTWS